MGFLSFCSHSKSAMLDGQRGDENDRALKGLLTHLGHHSVSEDINCSST